MFDVQGDTWGMKSMKKRQKGKGAAAQRAGNTYNNLPYSPDLGFPSP